ncbi:uncharacterized protein AB675_1079 [Cyphellophora attinorum]|uniref:Uncharacterized protein n=1 Tax=Cyphellophora attinorum TaxID=1664694 RepID=A0A0N1H1T1_9EURO|nr:uncharacterized protein AB675_1079 [Phialophora attinorum]KPI38184.1 hypothetical protein AB675_1079 [Phialophora attinorum]
MARISRVDPAAKVAEDKHRPLSSRSPITMTRHLVLFGRDQLIYPTSWKTAKCPSRRILRIRYRKKTTLRYGPPDVHFDVETQMQHERRRLEARERWIALEKVRQLELLEFELAVMEAERRVQEKQYRLAMKEEKRWAMVEEKEEKEKEEKEKEEKEKEEKEKEEKEKEEKEKEEKEKEEKEQEEKKQEEKKQEEKKQEEKKQEEQKQEEQKQEEKKQEEKKQEVHVEHRGDDISGDLAIMWCFAFLGWLLWWLRLERLGKGLVFFVEVVAFSALEHARMRHKRAAEKDEEKQETRKAPKLTWRESILGWLTVLFIPGLLVTMDGGGRSGAIIGES